MTLSKAVPAGSRSGRTGCHAHDVVGLSLLVIPDQSLAELGRAWLPQFPTGPSLRYTEG